MAGTLKDGERLVITDAPVEYDYNAYRSAELLAQDLVNLLAKGEAVTIAVVRKQMSTLRARKLFFSFDGINFKAKKSPDKNDSSASDLILGEIIKALQLQIDQQFRRANSPQKINITFSYSLKNSSTIYWAKPHVPYSSEPLADGGGLDPLHPTAYEVMIFSKDDYFKQNSPDEALAKDLVLQMVSGKMKRFWIQDGEDVCVLNFNNAVLKAETPGGLGDKWLSLVTDAFNKTTKIVPGEFFSGNIQVMFCDGNRNVVLKTHRVLR